MRGDNYTAADVAKICGVHVDTFRRTRLRRHRDDGLPQPFQSSPMLFDKAAIDFWRQRTHPLRADMAPANDLDAPLQPATDDEHLRRFHEAYR